MKDEHVITEQRRRRLIAALVLAGTTAACSDGAPAAEPASEVPPGALQVTGTDQLAFDPEQLTSDAGEVTVALTSESGVAHDFVIEEGDQRVTTAPKGETAVGTVALEAGTYTFFCSIPGHRNAGMEGTLEVTD